MLSNNDVSSSGDFGLQFAKELECRNQAGSYLDKMPSWVYCTDQPSTGLPGKKSASTAGKASVRRKVAFLSETQRQDEQSPE